jgi:hypothetical protein
MPENFTSLLETDKLKVAFESRKSNILFITFSELNGYWNHFAYNSISRIGADHLSFRAFEGDMYQSLGVDQFKKIICNIGLHYDFYYFYGCSSGAHAAIYFASSLDIKNKIVLALSPLNSLHPGMTKYPIQSVYKLPTYSFDLNFVPKNVIIIYDCKLPSDHTFVNLVYSHGINCQFIRMHWTGHNIIRKLISFGAIEPILNELLQVRNLTDENFSNCSLKISLIIKSFEIEYKKTAERAMNFSNSSLWHVKNNQLCKNIYDKLVMTKLVEFENRPDLMATAYSTYATLLLRLNLFQEAKVYIDKTLEIYPDADAYKNLLKSITEALSSSDSIQ